VRVCSSPFSWGEGGDSFIGFSLSYVTQCALFLLPIPHPIGCLFGLRTILFAREEGRAKETIHALHTHTRYIHIANVWGEESEWVSVASFGLVQKRSVIVKRGIYYFSFSHSLIFPVDHHRHRHRHCHSHHYHYHRRLHLPEIHNQTRNQPHPTPVHKTAAS